MNRDSDGDGMPDDWERAHCLNPLVNDANGDPDGDGFTNLAEYLAGTDPNVGVVPTITATATATESQASIQWNAIIGKTYRVQFKDAIDEPWADLSGDITGVGRGAIKVDAAVIVHPARFYRVLLLP